MACINHFDNWRKYLSPSDFTFLIEFIDKADMKINNNKILILCGPPRSGKSTLIKEIKNYIGNVNFHDNNYFEGEKYFQPKRLAIHICGINGYQHEKYIAMLKEIFESDMAIISDTNNIESIHPTILENSHVIKMTHVF
jgi:AAA+ ATPase superfamily predicted ATPase